MKNLVVKPHRPLHTLLILVAAIVIISTLTWLVLDKSHWAFITARITGNQQMREILQINRKLETENVELRDKVLWLERNREIDEQAAEGLRGELVKLQDQYYQQKGELEFYKGIMTTTEGSLGLNVQGVYIEKLSTDNLYRYRIILTNVTKSDNIVEGKANIVLLGEQQGETRQFSFSDISISKNPNWRFKFKNFKRFEGDIVLPPEFVPKRIAIELLSKGKNERMLERSFDWQQVVG